MTTTAAADTIMTSIAEDSPGGPGLAKLWRIAKGRPCIPLWPDTAELLDLSKSRLYSAARRGELPIVTLSGRMFCSVSGLARLLGGEPLK